MTNNELPNALEEYIAAPSGEGPLAARWKTDPSSLVHELCAAIERCAFVRWSIAHVCRNATNGIGELASEWIDKPHRLIYDLCTELRGISENYELISELSDEIYDSMKALGTQGDVELRKMMRLRETIKSNFPNFNKAQQYSMIEKALPCSFRQPVPKLLVNLCLDLILHRGRVMNLFDEVLSLQHSLIISRKQDNELGLEIAYRRANLEYHV